MKILLPAVSKDEGFTLLEALIAMVILTIGILALNAMQVSSIRYNARASSITIASNWAAQQVEEILHTSYDDLIDGDLDGTNQDGDNNGVDDDGGDFGLDDITAATLPDGQRNSPDGQYTVFWNIAEDLPMAGIKTVRIHVQDTVRPAMNPVTIQYFKQGAI